MALNMSILSIISESNSYIKKHCSTGFWLAQRELNLALTFIYRTLHWCVCLLGISNETSSNSLLLTELINVLTLIG